MNVVGAALPRVDAAPKVTGKAGYAADVRLPRMLHAKLLRSPHPHARIRSIDVSRALACEGVRAVLCREDLGEPAPAYGYFIKDQPIVAVDKVRHIGDVVAAVAADDEAAAVRAVSLIEVDYEPLAAVVTIEEALAPGAPELFEDAPAANPPRYGRGATGILRPRRNVCYEFRYEAGSPEAWNSCDEVFEDTFTFSRMQHFHLEPFVSVAAVDGDQIEVWSSTQDPFAVRKELARVLGHPENRIRIHVANVGGGFGAKNHCKTEPIAILLSRLAGRPVRLALTTEEAFFTQTQHAALLRIRTGVRADGTFVARQSDVLLDAGGYADASPLVAEKAGYRVAGAYRWEHVASSCACVMTNTTPAGPFRGFGAPQATWAGESQVDMIAHRLGIDPYELRLRNLKQLGEPYAPGESGIDSDLEQGLRLVTEAIGYRERRREPGRGMGIAIGVKDAGGMSKAAQARVKVATGGDVYLQCGTVELGQGATTALSQIVAEILAVPVEKVVYVPVNTDTTPFDQGTNSLSAVTVMGSAVARATESVRDQVLKFAAERLGCEPGELCLDDWRVRRGEQTHPLPALITDFFGGAGFEFSGDGYAKTEESPDAPFEAPSAFWEIGWAAAEVAVDRETGKVDVLRLVVSGDAGRVIHEQACRGQDEGGAVMGLAQALFEEVRYDGAMLVNGEALEYRVPLADDLPPDFWSLTQAQGHGPGPFGAKGMGECGLLPVPAAIANAIEDAVGARVTDLPLTPERVLTAIRRLNT